MSSVWLHDETWAGAPRLIHGTLLRAGFETEGKLSFAETVALAGDRLLGRIRAAGEAGIPHEGSPVASFALVGADQVHGDRVESIRSPDAFEAARAHPAPGFAGGIAREFPETDSLVTSLPGVLLVIQTADCVPLLLADVEAGVIGACHGGWRGLIERIGAKTVARMVELGARPERVRAWIAPCIRVENYEVGSELVGRFRAEFPDEEVSPDGMRLDLARAVAAQLREAGLPPGNLSDSGVCTFGDADRCHSFRRRGAGAGRMLTVVGLRPPVG